MGLIDLIRKMNDTKKNVNISLIGLPGAGKSYGGVKLLQKITGIESVDIMEYVHFRGEPFLKAIETPTEKFESHFHDDIGATYSAREWWKSEQIEFVKKVQVARKDNKNLFMSTPHPKLADSALGCVTHILITLDYWKSSTVGIGSVRQHEVKTEENGVKEYWKFYGNIEFETLDKRIARAYEDKKVEELKIESKKETPKKRDIALSNLIEYIRKKDRLSYAALGELTCLSGEMVRELHRRALFDILATPIATNNLRTIPKNHTREEKKMTQEEENTPIEIEKENGGD